MLPAARFYLAPTADDHNAGTIDRPWATLAGARDGVRASGKLGREAVEVNFAAGVYCLESTVVFSADDSGHTAATQAGLREGDVIYSLEGQAVRTPEDLQRLIQAAPPIGPLRLGVRREQKEVNVILLDHPPMPARAEPPDH
jgi:S1-C subfamily serine protease